ncbi:sensor histidine kinase [Staphylococcus simulans]|uniref:sensor histidine kinase n=1 Tax=Staphylococcus simulans TaxID=1286 RepID=UPI000E6776AE|nr:sensor histidine kinase [Staphylococcus simulans]RIN61086.1 sensor histidine kinase [Staphylococcus simulans]
MLNLFMLLLERVGLIILLAYLLMNFNYFKNLMHHRETWRAKWQLAIMFVIFALLSNVTGVVIRDSQILSGQLYTHLAPDTSLANTRVLTIGVSGLVGGPGVALVVGIISGIYRFYIGGANAFTYFVSSILIALVSGYVGRYYLKAQRYPPIFLGVIVGALLEVIQMTCILLFAEHSGHAWSLVSFIAIPMTLMNSIGTAIFLSIIISTIKQEEQMRGVQTHDVLQLANETLPYFREGLTEASAFKAAQIIKDLMQVQAVAITNRHDILAHVGAGSDHHVPQKAIITDLSKTVIQSGKIKEAHSREEIGCHHPNCPLEAAIVIPLHIKDKVVGTLKLYFTDAHRLTFVEKQLATGLANIFSSQLELGQAETQSKLLKDAEIKSLQAQVNPHFFFNAINTISALVRIDSEKARNLLLQLSQFFRSNLQGARNNTITLDKELQQVEAYLSLEQARFPNRFNIDFDIDPAAQHALLPPFIIQVLVENAIRHAFRNRRSNNNVKVTVKLEAHYLYLTVKDNGMGIPKNKMPYIGKAIVHSESGGTGSALENLNLRLSGLYGPMSMLKINSNEDGTTVRCAIPYRTQSDEGGQLI